MMVIAKSDRSIRASRDRITILPYAQFSVLREPR